MSRIAAVAAVSYLAGSGPAQAMTAEEAFADGNRLFREDLYWAALLRYEQAAEAGMANALLYYNTGVAHYKARQFNRAVDAFEKAAASPRLEVLAHYNLGLATYAAGDRAAALRWFRKARDQERSRELGKLATQAIELIRRDVMMPEPDTESEAVADEEPVRELEREPRPFSDFEFYATAGFGSDDNVYRSPSESYLDLSNPNLPVQVDPIVQTGSFVPVSIGARYLINSFEHESFFARYRGFGHFYSGEELANADEYSQELALGTEFRKDRENRRNRVFSAFTVAQHHETFFDPDDGIARTVNGVDISDRYSYLRYGPEISTRQSWRKFAFRFWGKAQLWNYENVDEVSEYDHEYFRVGTYLQYKFTKTSLLRLTAEGYMRNFSDRPSFELDGTQPIGVPTVEYTYIDYGMAARQRLTGNIWFGVKYVFTDRRDMYLGYNDYTRDGFGAEFHLRLGDRFALDAEALYRIYNFTNAFAYNNPAAGRKTLETADGRIGISYEMPWNLRLNGNYSYSDVSSNDARIAHERSIFMLSLQWSYD
jgi:tetratricopeptide (TPR) repeat protein